jgi:hypothetical protein
VGDQAASGNFWTVLDVGSNRVPKPGGVMHQRSLIPLEVGQQHADLVFQAPDASHAALVHMVGRWVIG